MLRNMKLACEGCAWSYHLEGSMYCVQSVDGQGRTLTPVEKVRGNQRCVERNSSTYNYKADILRGSIPLRKEKEGKAT